MNARGHSTRAALCAAWASGQLWGLLINNYSHQASHQPIPSLATITMLSAMTAERALRELVRGKDPGLAFTEPSVPAGWGALPLNHCLLGHYETAGLNVNGDLRTD
jgi:hypothetical protein